MFQTVRIGVALALFTAVVAGFCGCAGDDDTAPASERPSSPATSSTVRAEAGVNRRGYLSYVSVACTGTVIQQELARRRLDSALNSGKLSDRQIGLRTARYLMRLAQLHSAELEKLADVPAPPSLLSRAESYADAHARQIQRVNALAAHMRRAGGPGPGTERRFDDWEAGKREISRAGVKLGISCPDRKLLDG